MKFYAIRPKRRGRRLKTKAALYTVAFDIGELRRHDSSFNGFCRNDCEFGIDNKCEEQCVKDGEYGRLLFIWKQQGYLIRFFSTFRNLLSSKRYDYIDIKEAIGRHNKLLAAIEDYLLRGDLGDFFIHLYKKPDNKVYHPESKFKSHLFYQDFENWIRIYAVKYTDDATGVDNYIITGGGIKLVEKMSDNAVVEYEEKKQDAVIRYLIENEITTREQIETLIL